MDICTELLRHYSWNINTLPGARLLVSPNLEVLRLHLLILTTNQAIRTEKKGGCIPVLQPSHKDAMCCLMRSWSPASWEYKSASWESKPTLWIYWWASLAYRSASFECKSASWEYTSGSWSTDRPHGNTGRPRRDPSRPRGNSTCYYLLVPVSTC